MPQPSFFYKCQSSLVLWKEVQCEKKKKKGVTTSIIETKGKKKLPLLPIDNSTKKASKQFCRSFKKRQKMPEGFAKKAVMLGFFAHKNPKWVVVNDFRMVTYLDIHSHFLPNIVSLVFARFAKCVVKMKEKPFAWFYFWMLENWDPSLSYRCKYALWDPISQGGLQNQREQRLKWKLRAECYTHNYILCPLSSVWIISFFWWKGDKGLVPFNSEIEVYQRCGQLAKTCKKFGLPLSR